MINIKYSAYVPVADIVTSLLPNMLVKHDLVIKKDGSCYSQIIKDF